MASELVRRVGFAIVAIPLALLITWNGGWLLALLLAAAGALGCAELYVTPVLWPDFTRRHL
ncbi:MAG: hypothetical protein ACREM9_12715, partial [Gemmatimonadales bacterium]